MSKPQIFVKGYPVQTTQKDLTQYFDRIGHIDQIRLMSHFAFVTFSSMRQAQKAIYKLDGKKFNGKILIVQMAKQFKKSRQDASLDRNVCFLCKKSGHWKINCPQFRNKIDPHAPRKWRNRQEESQIRQKPYKSRRYSRSQSKQKKKKSKQRKQKNRSYSDSESSRSSSQQSYRKQSVSSSQESRRDKKKSKSRKHKSSKKNKKSKSNRKDHKSKSKHSKKHSKRKNYSSSPSSQSSQLNSSSVSSHQKSPSQAKPKHNKQNSEKKFENNTAEKSYEQRKGDNRHGQATKTPQKRKNRQQSISKSRSNQKKLSF